MASPTTTLPSATLAALDGATAHALAGKRLFRNTVWSGIGSAAPMLVAVVAVPRLIHGLGADRFGILALAWMVIGYLSLLDFGLGGAITRLVADRIALGRDGYSVLSTAPFSVRNMVIAFALVAGASQLTAMTRHLLPKMLYLAVGTGVTAVLALPLMKRAPVLVEA
jgi:O-antigen/teichoic acid export membrane protein